MDISTIGTVVGIVAICYVIGLGCKAYEKIPDKWIPIIMAVCGGVLGVAGLYTMLDFPAGDVINAVAVGMASGLSATGVNQLYKQQCKQRANNRPLIFERNEDMKDYVEVNEEKCGEVHNCMRVKSVDGKTYCRGCGSVIAEHINSTKHMEK